MSICPHCEKNLVGVFASEIKVTVNQRPVESVAYFCSQCRKVISVGPNPVYLRSQIVDDIVHELKKRLK